ncbi:uncharacterized protein BO95DRAFT_126492 [Aspergillus brunneoviolaceus CBS 621.78]|uniref:Uncharacterized protein n=1 Tax=Aspergillus brunneoviolaceus CBS 621.78 TaxID=1450534 RepID=A0ACD1G9E6_9EURO|nr:hypothetical protein BO95DRAFT_126492 [Aspergillus brunneoviolaceus CBS 621.78]RAH45915.1 hypothetical protein BO95DRAFT_126492 [Aspergillus brunneoviolaceus CBS 621.78]
MILLLLDLLHLPLLSFYFPSLLLFFWLLTLFYWICIWLRKRAGSRLHRRSVGFGLFFMFQAAHLHM